MRAPLALGVKVALIEQCAPAAMGEVHVLETVKSPLLAPPGTMPVMAKGALPLFVSVTICEALVEPTPAPEYVKFAAERSAVGCSSPCPDKVMDWGVSSASSVSVIAAVRVPAALGVNVTLIVHVA